MVRLHQKLKQRLPIWAVWLVYVGATAALLWLLMVGIGIWLLTFGIKPNVRKMYQAVFDNPRSEVRRLRGGGYTFIGYDVWLTFESDKVIRLKDPAGFTPIQPSEVSGLNLGELACEKLIQDSRKPAVLYRTKPERHVPNGELWVHDPATNRYCYQDWHYE